MMSFGVYSSDVEQASHYTAILILLQQRGYVSANDTLAVHHSTYYATAYKRNQ